MSDLSEQQLSVPEIKLWNKEDEIRHESGALHIRKRTSWGGWVTLKPIPPTLFARCVNEYEEAVGKEPSVPIYMAEFAGGERHPVELKPDPESWIVTDRDTEEENTTFTKENEVNWKEYEQALATWSDGLAEAYLQLYIRKGMEIEVPQPVLVGSREGAKFRYVADGSGTAVNGFGEPIPYISVFDRNYAHLDGERIDSVPDWITDRIDRGLTIPRKQEDAQLAFARPILLKVEITYYSSVIRYLSAVGGQIAAFGNVF